MRTPDPRKTVKISIELDHSKALAAYTAAGNAYPTIPQGKNTVWHHFETTDGRQAVIINQRGFVPAAIDNEEQVNGCGLAVVIDDDIDPLTARKSLDQWVQEILGE